MFVTPAGFKPATFGSVVRGSSQVSYGAKPYCFVEALFLKSECKGIVFYLNLQIFLKVFSVFVENSWICTNFVDINQLL